MIDCLPECVSKRIARSITSALREELSTYPKPGLVSYEDCGSHPDMCARDFEKAIIVLEPFFQQMAEDGISRAPLAVLQRTGLAAEKAMLAATGQKNTHRGAIFCLGLFAAAAGLRTQCQRDKTLGAIICETWGPALPDPRELSPVSYGIAICRQHGIAGVRGEAARGFPAVYRRGLPVWRQALARTTREAAKVQLFFELLDECEDTTLLKRGGIEGNRLARSLVNDFLQAGGVFRADWFEQARTIHQRFVEHNLTAGGAADLLATTLFVYEMEHGSSLRPSPAVRL